MVDHQFAPSTEGRAEHSLYLVLQGHQELKIGRDPNHFDTSVW